MGEAKRRKKLDPTWGKKTGLNWKQLKRIREEFSPPRPVAPDPHLPDLKVNCLDDWDASSWRWEYEQDPIPWQLMQKELNAIDERIRKGWSVTPYQHGQAELFRALIPCVTEGDANYDLLKSAGESLWESGGSRDMFDALSAWTPRCCHRLVDVVWDGIGDWKG